MKCKRFSIQDFMTWRTPVKFSGSLIIFNRLATCRHSHHLISSINNSTDRKLTAIYINLKIHPVSKKVPWYNIRLRQFINIYTNSYVVFSILSLWQNYNKTSDSIFIMTKSFPLSQLNRWMLCGNPPGSIYLQHRLFPACRVAWSIACN